MKRAYNILLSLILGFGMFACTSDFMEINTNPKWISEDEASARYFITTPEYKLYAPDRFPYWRAHLIHTDRFAGHFTFGHNFSWWDDELAYVHHGGYTDAAWNWLEGYFGNIDNFLKLTEAGGDFENELMNAVGFIVRGLYFQMYTDLFGDIPFTETGIEGIVTPIFDDQKLIYDLIIKDLNSAMAIIGDNDKTGEADEDLGDNDIIFKGDLQKWKKLANALKLRMGLRALGAQGADFAVTAITEALAGEFPETLAETAVLKKDLEITQWNSAAYGDVWWNFGGGSDWTVGLELIDLLRDYNDPRLGKYAKPALGGDFKFVKPETDSQGLWDKRIDFITNTLDDAGVSYTKTVDADSVFISMPENIYYVGQPVRLNIGIKPLVRFEFFSTPADIVINPKGSDEIFPEVVLSSGESFLLRAEAAVLGFGGDAQSLFEDGIRQAMALWGVGPGAADTYIANSDLAQLNGTQEENLEKISLQRWIAAYTDGFEAFSIVRKRGYPASLAAGVTDPDIYGLGDINGAYPTRMQYGSSAYSKNGENVDKANAKQGPDKMDTKVWWDK
jgi:hypothetical protein